MKQFKSRKEFLNILFQILFWGVRGGPNSNIQASLKPMLKPSSCFSLLDARTTSTCQSPYHPQALLKSFLPKPHTRQALTSLMVVWTAVRSVLQAGRLAVARRIASLSGAFCSCFFCRENDLSQKSAQHREDDNEHGTTAQR